jgi:hypothetical protein
MNKMKGKKKLDNDESAAFGIICNVHIYHLAVRDLGGIYSLINRPASEIWFVQSLFDD